MPKRISVTVYSFKELLEEGKNQKATEKARQWLQDANAYDGYAETDLEEWTKILELIGFDNPKISYSGFGNQGDGACFTAKVDLTKIINFLTMTHTPTEGVMGDEPKDWFNFVVNQLGHKEPVTLQKQEFQNLLTQLDDLTVNIYKSEHRYSHPYTCKIESVNTIPEETPDYEKFASLFNELMTELEELRVNLCHLIYKTLETGYQYAVSDEALLELAEANDYQFLPNGTFFQ